MNVRINQLLLFLLAGILNLQGLQAQSMESVTVAEPASPSSLNPLTNFSATGTYIGEYLYFSLLGTDKKTGEFVPQLAENLPEVSEDLKVYTYTLHPQARFNSGKKVKASDVLFSLKLRINPALENEHDRSQFKEITSAEALDDTRIRIALRHPSPQGLRLTSDFPVFAADVYDPEGTYSALPIATLMDPNALQGGSAAVIGDVARRVNAFAKSLPSYNPEAVSGPYLLLEWKKDEKIVLEANKKFWGKKLSTPPNSFFRQNVNQIVFLLNTEESDTRSGLFNRRVDLVTSIEPSLFFELSEIPSLTSKYDFQSVPGPAYEYIGINMKGKSRDRKPLFEDANVRRALAHLVNVDLLQARVNFGLGQRLAADYPTYMPEYENKDLGILRYDQAKAKKMLAAAGWTDTDENGLVDKAIDGEQVQFVAELIFNENAPQRKKIAEHVQKNAQEIGILVVLQEVSMEEYLDRLSKGEFDLYVGGWVSDPNENSYRQIWHTENWGSGANFVGFGDSESDALIERYDQLIDPDARIALSGAIQEKIYNAQPYIFLWVRQHNVVLRKSVNANLYNLRPGFWIAEWE